MRYSLELTKEELDHVKWRAGTWTPGYKTMHKVLTGIGMMLGGLVAALILGAHIARYMAGDITLGQTLPVVVFLGALVVGIPYITFGGFKWSLIKTIDREHSISRKIRKAKREGEW